MNLYWVEGGDRRVTALQLDLQRVPGKAFGLLISKRLSMGESCCCKLFSGAMCWISAVPRVKKSAKIGISSKNWP